MKKLCPYCNKKYREGIYIKWHGEKCKMNPNKEKK